MIKTSPPHQRFSGDGYSFCVVKGTIYQLNYNGEYDADYPRLKVKQAIEFMRTRLAPTLRQRRLIDKLKEVRDQFDRESTVIDEQNHLKIAKLQNELRDLQQKVIEARAKRSKERDKLTLKITDSANEMYRIGSLRDKQQKLLIRFDASLKNVCVGCNEVPLDEARKLVVQLARMAKKK